MIAIPISLSDRTTSEILDISNQGGHDAIHSTLRNGKQSYDYFEALYSVLCEAGANVRRLKLCNQ